MLPCHYRVCEITLSVKCLIQMKAVESGGKLHTSLQN